MSPKHRQQFTSWISWRDVSDGGTKVALKSRQRRKQWDAYDQPAIVREVDCVTIRNSKNISHLRDEESRA